MKKTLVVLVAVVACLMGYAQTIQQADSLHQRGRELVNEGKIAEGREYTRQAMELRKKLLDEVNEDYITSRNNHVYSFEAKRTACSYKEKGWDDPKYWAAFILLDGLD